MSLPNRDTSTQPTGVGYCAKRSGYYARRLGHIYTMRTTVNGELVAAQCSWCGSDDPDPTAPADVRGLGPIRLTPARREAIARARVAKGLPASPPSWAVHIVEVQR